MKKALFYKRQRMGRFQYRLIVGAAIFGMLIGIVAIGVSVLHPFGHPQERQVQWILYVTELAVMTGLLVYAIKSFGGERKRIYQRYVQLSDAEQRQIDVELATPVKSGRCGRELLYFKHRGFVDFIHYRDLGWVYAQNNTLPLIMPVGDLTITAATTESRLIIYTRAGKRLTGHTGMHTDMLIAELKEHAPQVVYGYSKERSIAAKKDFERFLYENRAMPEG